MIVGVDAVVLEARTVSERVCPRCGTSFEVPDKGPGRRPVWCSARCRRRASAERIAALDSGAAVRVVEVPRAHRPDPDARLPLPSMETLARLFLSSDYQCKTLLQSLVHRYASGDIGDELRSAMEQFAASVDLQRVLSDDPSYRQARDEIETLRKRLRHDVDAADQRDQELARLRHESEELRQLRIRVAELESVVASAAYPLHQAGQHDVMLSRQQRRAAERAARKGRY